MAFIPSSGSVVAFQSNPSVLQVLATIANPSAGVANQSVSGTVGASIIGLPPVNVVGTPSISGTVLIGNTVDVSGSVVARLQSTNASVITVGSPVANQSVSGTVLVGNQVTVVSSIAGGIFPISGSVAAFITNTTVPISGSVVAAQIGTRITSVVSTVPSSVLVGASIFGQLPAGTAVLGSVATLQGTNPWNVAGSVAAFQAGTIITSVVSTVPSSVLVGASIFGQLPAGTAPLGSVATLQGTNPWITNFQNSSIIAINAGSVLTIPGNTSVITVLQGASIVGTYAEDAAHATADKGIFVLGVRNDAVASFAGSNLEYTGNAVDSAGRTLTKPFAPEESRMEGYNSVVSTSVTTLVAAAGTGLKTYITDIVLVNTGAATTLVTFRSGGGASVLGYGIAPTGGGSNMIGFATPMMTLANQTFDMQATTATSVLYATVKGFKAP